MAAGADARRSRAARRYRHRVGDGDAGYGEILEFRTGLEQRRLPYMLGISGQFAVWIGRPPADLGPSTRAVTAASIGATQVATWAAQQPARGRRVTWRNGPRRAWRARFIAVRVTPVVLWRQHRPLQTGWLLAERPLGRAAGPLKWYISNLPPTTQLRTFSPRRPSAVGDRAALSTAQRGTRSRSLRRTLIPGMAAHVVLTALAYTWLHTNDDAACRAAPRSRSCAP